MPALITPAMRKAAPELCQEMDQLRAERKSASERRWYLNSTGAEEEAAAQQQRITEIDAEVAALHARAKEQLLTGIAKDLSQGATLLQVATMDAETIRGSIVQETQRQGEAMMKLVAQQGQLDIAFREAISTMEGAAENLTDGGEEQATESEAAVAGAGSSTDMACPKCAKICRGVKGLATHQRRCKAPINVEQVPGAEAPAEVNPAAADKEQVPDGGIVPYICGYCTGTFLDAGILDRHERLCKAGAFKGRSTDEDIDSKFTCLVCSKEFTT